MFSTIKNFCRGKYLHPITHSIVFAVKYRAALINKIWNDKLHGYITGIIQNYEHKMLQINSEPDHIHNLIGMRPHQSVSALMQIVKSESTNWINENEFCAFPLLGRKDMAHFLCKEPVHNVISTYKNQEKHHSKQNFLG
jgi:REP element-mobilizing transposase RayT